MSRLPEGWAEVELGEVWHESRARVRPDTIARTDYIGLEHVEGGTNRITGAGRSDGVKSTVAVFSEGDILYGRLRPYLNKVIRPPFAGVASTEFLVFKETQALANGLLMRLLSSSDLVAYASANSAGVNLPRISAKRLAEYRFRLAPVPEQHRIVAKIESLFARLDEGIAALKRAEANLERYRASVLKSAVEGRLTEQWRRENPPEETGEDLLRRILAERRRRWEAEQLAKFEARGRKPPKNWRAKYKEPVAPDTGKLPKLPEGWCWATVDQIVWAMMNGYGKRSNTPGGTPRMVLRLADIRHDQISYQSPRYLDCTSQQIAKYRLAERDVLIVRVNGSPDLVGRLVDCRNTNGDVLFCDHFIRAKCTTLLAAAWLRLCSNTERFRSHVERTRVSTAGQHTVSQGVILPFALPLPPEKEVLAILALADLLVSQSKPVEVALADGRVNASALRQSILKSAFEGRLVPQDPADEPAAVLLDRIRAERAAERNRRKRRPSRRKRQPKTPIA